MRVADYFGQPRGPIVVCGAVLRITALMNDFFEELNAVNWVSCQNRDKC